MIFGYARVSTEEQNLDMQIDSLQQYGAEKIYQEKMTGTRKDRQQLEELLKVLRKGDKVIVYKLDRISRSTKHLIELSELFNEMDVDFVSIHDNIDTSTAMGKFFFRTMASIAELERDIISERTKSGLKAARARGKKGGRPSKKTDKVQMALKMYGSKEYSIKEITEATGLGKTTLYRYLNNKTANKVKGNGYGSY
ncbi:recombinase family protein [Bacillus badius]|uniref:recombinase family protein n=1 Tax=Bacillus badius TaxID=1455 RepID=UPI002E1A8F38|nr:recombinase family protein [Bacillus badius]